MSEETPRKCSTCRGLGTVYPRSGPAIRIDTMRARLAAVGDLLFNVLDEIEDLHALAYDRPRAVEAPKVRSSAEGYALDTHGSVKARDAYRALSQTTLDLAEDLTEALHDAARLLGEGGLKGNARRQIASLELAERITAQETRVGEGGYVPVRRHPQPDRDTALATATKEAKRLKRERDKALRAIPEQYRVNAEERNLLGEIRRLVNAASATRQERQRRRAG